ncbi:MAG TPA: hypothetical protein DCP03_22110 [Polaromonas sp.]|nr:hypothetical protein [Polaromonas sp.]
MAGLLALSIAGCGGGSDGAAGAPGAPGAPGATGPAGGTGTGATASVNGASLTADQWQALTPTIDPASITVSINSPPVVTFKVTDGKGNPVAGLGGQRKATTALTPTNYNIAFTLAKLVPGTNNEPSKWVSYLVTSPAGTIAAPTTVGTFPTSDSQGTMVDNGDGSYKYTFYRDVKLTAAAVAGLTDSTDGLSKKADLGDVSYDPTLTHRLGIIISGSQPGTGTNTPTSVQSVAPVPLLKTFNIGYDFVPAGGAVTATRDIVVKNSCSACHDGKGIGHVSAPSATNGIPAGLSVGRNDPRLCVTCHTDQIRYSFSQEASSTTVSGVTTLTGTTRQTTAVVGGRALGNYPNLIHKMHMGEDLLKQNYYFNADDAGKFNDVKYPQDVRNCTTCHDASATAVNKTANGDNWKNVPSILACGSCHDGINFADGTGTTLAGATTGHVGGAKANNATCILCHDATTIPVYHVPVTKPDANNTLAGGTNANTNASYMAAYAKNLPTGAIRVTYDLKSVAVTAGQPVFTFRFMNGTTPLVFNTAPALADATVELMPNFVGGPSAYFVAAMPQDGITAPADYNISASGYIRNIWNKTATGAGAGTMTGPDTSGYYTLTLTGVSIPASAVMKTGGLGYTYSLNADIAKSTMPLTQTNVAGYAYTGGVTKQGGLSVPAPNVTKLVSGDTARRAIVDTARCNTCHNALGVFAKAAFHAGQRNDANSCAFCHNPNRTSSGWSADSTSFIHGIHGAAKRDVNFTWHAGSTTDGFWDIGYPGVLTDCQQCHLPNTVNFGASANKSAAENGSLLYSTVATGRYADVGGTTTTYTYASGACTAGTSAAQTALGAFSLSPYIAKNDTSYGLGYTANVGLAASNGCKPDGTVYTIPAGNKLDADGNTLVNSPIASACFGCHTSNIATAHMTSNGGALYATRASLTSGGKLVNNEQCVVCHGAGKVADAEVIHQH